MSDSSPPTPLRELPPRGHYIAHEVGRLAGVSGHTIGQWKNYGYIRASQEPEVYPNIYSYQDVGEAMAVHHLLVSGAALRSIGRAIQVLRETYGLNWPLSPSELRVHGREILIKEDDRLWDLTDHRYPWNEIIGFQAVHRIASDLRRGGWAAREHPSLRFIEVNPDRLSGRPVIRGTRLPVEDVALLASRPSGRAALRRDYDLSGPAVTDALLWWESVKRYEQQAA